MSDLSDQELIELLRKNGFKATPQRLAICKYILSSKKHPTAEKIYSDIKKEHKTLSQATVYKTLDLLENLGLVTELSFDNGFSRFDPNQKIHVNVICSICKTISDYSSDKISDFLENIKSDINSKIIGQRFDIYTICEKCLKDKK